MELVPSAKSVGIYTLEAKHGSSQFPIFSPWKVEKGNKVPIVK
jgi:hypothetical protein